MIFLNSNWPPHSFCYGGGGGKKPAEAIQSAPVPLPAPPVTRDNEAVVQAEHDLARANLAKKSIKKTIFAGDTGGFQPTGPAKPATYGTPPK